MDVTVIVDETDEPGWIVIVDGLAATEKPPVAPNAGCVDINRIDMNTSKDIIKSLRCVVNCGVR